MLGYLYLASLACTGGRDVERGSLFTLFALTQEGSLEGLLLFADRACSVVLASPGNANLPIGLCLYVAHPAFTG